MTEEIWKDIEGYEGYQISNIGRVRRNDRLLKTIKYNTGYLRTGLCKDGKQKLYYVHRLVAKAFIPNPDNLPQVNHKDEDKTNNRVDNLEWCDAKYNMNYGTRNERVGNLYSKHILAIKDGKIEKYYKSTREAQKDGYNNSLTTRCCNNKIKEAYGYKWQYVDVYLADWWDMEMEKAA